MVTLTQLRAYNEAHHAGLSIVEIAEKTGLSHSTVERFHRMKKKKNRTFQAYQMKVQLADPAFNRKRLEGLRKKNKANKPPATTAIVHVPQVVDHRRKDEMTARVQTLHQQGLSLHQIMAKTGLGKSGVNYHLFGKQKLGRALSVAPRQQGESPDGNRSTINKHVLVGYAFAKTEGYVHFLSTRLGLAPEVLSRRLAELLGHPPMRQEVGPGD